MERWGSHKGDMSAVLSRVLSPLSPLHYVCSARWRQAGEFCVFHLPVGSDPGKAASVILLLSLGSFL